MGEARRNRERFDRLTRAANARGWNVELVRVCEDADTPGKIGTNDVTISTTRRAIKVRTEGTTPAQRAVALERAVDRLP